MSSKMLNKNRNKGRGFMQSEIFAKRLKMARKELGYTQEEIANQINVKQTTYGRYENGLREPNINTMVELAMLLGVRLDWLCGMTSEGGPVDHAKKIQQQRETQKILNMMEKEAELAMRLTA